MDPGTSTGPGCCSRWWFPALPVGRGAIGRVAGPGRGPPGPDPTHQPAAEDVEIIPGEDGAGVGGKHLDAPGDLRIAWSGEGCKSRGASEETGMGVRRSPPSPAHAPPAEARKGSVYFLMMRSMDW